MFKTTDGGKTWTNTKFIDENTGFTDIALDPQNSGIIYAASYQRRRDGCCFNAAAVPGAGSGKASMREDMDEADGQRSAARHGVRPNRARRVALEPERHLRAVRSG